MASSGVQRVCFKSVETMTVNHSNGLQPVMAFAQVLVSITLLGCASPATAAPPVETGQSVAVVYNSGSPESKRVARHYADKRGVPAEQMVGFDLPLAEEIDRTEFATRLQRPLFDWLVTQGLFSLRAAESGPSTTDAPCGVTASSVRYLVLCYGVPLKIRSAPELTETGTAELRRELRRNEAAVDSELAWLPRLNDGVHLAGLLTNAFYGTTNVALLHPTNGVLLVARLDGPTADIAAGLVDKALDAERDGLWGRAYVDMRGIKSGSYKSGDEVMQSAILMCASAGYDVGVDMSPTTFGVEYPLSQVAVYAGWYSGNASGPFARPTVEFMPGALAYHLHSFSASTLRSTNRHWCGPLLARGATVTVGSVYEPYLSGTSDIGTLLRNWLLLGASFGEAAWSAEFGFSWQTTVVGDPLYRPWGKNLDVRQHDLEQRGDPRLEWAYAMQADLLASHSQPLPSVTARLRSLPQTKSSAVLSEKLGDLMRLQKNPAEAAAAYAQALRALPSPQQAVRLRLTLAEAQLASGAEAEALTQLKEVLKAAPIYRHNLEFQRRLHTLAVKQGDVELTEQAQSAIRRLTQVSTNAASRSEGQTPTTSGSITNK